MVIIDHTNQTNSPSAFLKVPNSYLHRRKMVPSFTIVRMPDAVVYLTGTQLLGAKQDHKTKGLYGQQQTRMRMESVVLTRTSLQLILQSIL